MDDFIAKLETDYGLAIAALTFFIGYLIGENRGMTKRLYKLTDRDHRREDARDAADAEERRGAR